MKIYSEADDKKLNNAVSDYMAGGHESYDIIVYLTNNLLIKLIDDIVVDYEVTQELTKLVYEELFSDVKKYSENDEFLLNAERLATDYAYKYVKENMENLLNSDYQRLKGYRNITETVLKDNEKIVPKDFIDDTDKHYYILGLYRQLPIISKIVFQYYYIENMSVRNISKKMDCSSETTKKRLYYIKHLLKAAFITGADIDKQDGYSFSQMPVLQYLFREEAETVLAEEFRAGRTLKEDELEQITDTDIEYEEDEKTVGIWQKVIFLVIAIIVIVGLVIVLTKGIKKIEDEIFDDDKEATSTDATVSDATMTDPKEMEALEERTKERRYHYEGAVVEFCTENVGNLPGEDGQYDATDPMEFADEQYAVYDVDMDGKEELVMWLSKKPSTKDKHYFGIYEYDLDSDKWVKEYSGNHTNELTFYDNGTAVLISSDFEDIDNEWRASIFDFDMQENTYNKKYDIYYKDSNNEDSYYVMDESDKKLSDFLDEEEMTDWIKEQLGKEIIPLYMDLENMLEQKYRVAYIKLLWDKNEVLAAGDVADIGEAYINSGGNIESVVRMLQNNKDVVFEDDVTGYIGEQEVVTLDTDEDSVDIELTNFMNKIAVMGVQPGMNYDEAMAILEAHGFYYYSSYSQYSHQYSIGECMGDYCVRIDFEDGVITTVGIGTIKELW